MMLFYVVIRDSSFLNYSNFLIQNYFKMYKKKMLFSDVERKQISEIIAHYKATGRKMKLPIVRSGRKKQERTTSSMAKAGRKTIF
ncbi:MAG: hypothetical protein JWQ09_5165 [Segetibacter sp.]|nr:hypothetical protein [Segetibacter sp.]